MNYIFSIQISITKIWALGTSIIINMNLPENILMQQEQELKHSYLTVKSNLI